MPENTQTQPKKEKDPLDVGQIAVDAASSTIKKRVSDTVTAQLDQGVDPKVLFGQLLDAYGVPQTNSAVGKQQENTQAKDILKQVLDMAKTPIETGGTVNPVASFFEGKGLRSTPAMGPLGIDDAVKVMQLQNTEQKAGRDVKKQNLEAIQTILKLVPDLQKMLDPKQQGETIETDLAGQKTTRGIAQERRAAKLAEMGVEKQVQFKESQNAFDSFVTQFERAEQEIVGKLGPKALQSGMLGASVRIGGKGLEMMNQLPITTAFNAQMKATANQMARNVEGGRVTDQDRTVYANILVNALNGSSTTNSELLAVQLMNMDAKLTDDERLTAIDPQLESLANSKSSTLRRAAEIVQKVRANNGDKGIVQFDPVSKHYGRMFKNGDFVDLGPEKNGQPGFNLDHEPGAVVGGE